MSMMVSFVLSFFPRDVLDEILNLIESVSEDFLTTLLFRFSQNDREMESFRIYATGQSKMADGCRSLK